MVSDASKKKAAAKKAAAAAKRGGKSSATSSKAAADVPNGAAVGKLADGVGSMRISDRTCTGVLASHPLSRDIHVPSFFPLHLWFVKIRFCSVLSELLLNLTSENHSGVISEMEF